jgi:uncharacterized RDD family membrane protein YckC
VSTYSGDYTTLVPVTGEAVALDLRLAQFPSRTLALALDLLIQFGAMFLLFTLVGASADAVDGATLTAISLVAVVSILVVLPTVVETLTRGRSVGKLAAGLRVVRDDGGPVRFRHAFVRSLFMLVDFWFTSGAVGLISSLVSTKGKRLGDHFAGTVVIRQRVPAAAAVRTQRYFMPPQLEGWASSLDLTRLPDVTVMQARQFLSRAATIAPEIRYTMSLQLAAEVSAYVSPSAPPGTPPDVFLGAVLTERMRRATSPRPTLASALQVEPAGGYAAFPGVPGAAAAAPGAGVPGLAGVPGAGLPATHYVAPVPPGTGSSAPGASPAPPVTGDPNGFLPPA